MKYILPLVLLTFSMLVQAREDNRRDIFIHPLVQDSSTLVHFLNPNGDLVKTTLFCVKTTDEAKQKLFPKKEGGLFLSPGSMIILKADPTKSLFETRVPSPFKYYHFICLK